MYFKLFICHTDMYLLITSQSYRYVQLSILNLLLQFKTCIFLSCLECCLLKDMYIYLIFIKFLAVHVVNWEEI
jgi:hypothetical protein